MTENRRFTKHRNLPSKCSECSEKNYYWLDGTYGCKNGHVVARKDELSMWDNWRLE